MSDPIWQPDYGLEDALLALWPYRYWPIQREVIRGLIGHCKAIRKARQEEQRSANLERELFEQFLDSHIKSMPP